MPRAQFDASSAPIKPSAITNRVYSRVSKTIYLLKCPCKHETLTRILLQLLGCLERFGQTHGQPGVLVHRQGRRARRQGTLASCSTVYSPGTATHVAVPERTRCWGRRRHHQHGPPGASMGCRCRYVSQKQSLHNLLTRRLHQSNRMPRLYCLQLVPMAIRRTTLGPPSKCTIPK